MMSGAGGMSACTECAEGHTEKYASSEEYTELLERFWKQLRGSNLVSARQRSRETEEHV